MKQPHQDAFTSEKYILEIIKRLHIRCIFLGNEHLSMLPINWLNHREVPYFNVKIVQNFYNAYCTLKYFLLRNISRVRIPKPTALVIVFRVFMWTLSVINAGSRIIIHMQCFEMVSKKKTRSSVTGNMENAIPSLSSDSTMTSKKKKNLLATFKIQMKNHVYILN